MESLFTNLKPNIFESFKIAYKINNELLGVHVGEKYEEKEAQLKQLIQEAPSLKNAFKKVW